MVLLYSWNDQIIFTQYTILLLFIVTLKLTNDRRSRILVSVGTQISVIANKICNICWDYTEVTWERTLNTHLYHCCSVVYGSEHNPADLHRKNCQSFFVKINIKMPGSGVIVVVCLRRTWFCRLREDSSWWCFQRRHASL